MPHTLKLCLIEQAIPPQLDFLRHALDSLQPPGDDLVVIDEVLVETRRVFADLRRLLAGMSLHQPDPASPITRAELRLQLRHAVTHFALFVEHHRRLALSAERQANAGPAAKPTKRP